MLGASVSEFKSLVKVRMNRLLHAPLCVSNDKVLVIGERPQNGHKDPYTYSTTCSANKKTY